MIALRRLQPGDRDELVRVIRAIQESDPAFTFAFDFDESTDFVEYLELVAARERGERLTGTQVPSTFLVAVEGDVIVGRVSIRHTLNDFLRQYGGHIGYGVAPAYRRRGHATEMLRLSLPVAEEIGLTRVLLTCDDENTASAKVIEKNGGVLENVVYHEEAGNRKRRYWIDLTSVGHPPARPREP